MALFFILFFTGKIIPAKRADKEIELWRKAYFEISRQLSNTTSDRSIGTQALQRIAEEVDPHVR